MIVKVENVPSCDNKEGAEEGDEDKDWVEISREAELGIGVEIHFFTQMTLHQMVSRLLSLHRVKVNICLVYFLTKIVRRSLFHPFFCDSDELTTAIAPNR